MSKKISRAVLPFLLGALTASGLLAWGFIATTVSYKSTLFQGERVAIHAPSVIQGKAWDFSKLAKNK